MILWSLVCGLSGHLGDFLGLVWICRREVLIVGGSSIFQKFLWPCVDGRVRRVSESRDARAWRYHSVLQRFFLQRNFWKKTATFGNGFFWRRLLLATATFLQRFLWQRHLWQRFFLDGQRLCGIGDDLNLVSWFRRAFWLADTWTYIFWGFILQPPAAAFFAKVKIVTWSKFSF